MLAMNVASNIDVGDALRFDRVAITCVFGDPRDLRSWSGAKSTAGAAPPSDGTMMGGSGKARTFTPWL